MARKVFGSPRKRAVVALLLAGAVIGALFVGNAGAHFTQNTKHLGKHAWQQFIKQKADKRFINERDVAWAHVETIASVSFIKKRNFVSVSRPSTGIYCLTPKAHIDPAERIAIVSPENDHSAGGDLEPQWLSGGGDCAAGQFEVLTLQGGVVDNNVSFTIYVP